MKKLILENEIYVIKYKFFILKEHLYGCFIMIVNPESNIPVRVIGVVSLNPSVYEIDVHSSYSSIERLIYKYKLDEGINFELTQKLYSTFYNLEKQTYHKIIDGEISLITDTILMNIPSEKKNLKFEHHIEKISQPLHLTEKQKNISQTIETIQEQEKFYIKTKPVLDIKTGVSPDKLKIKKVIECELADNREIAKYIINLLYGKDKKVISGKIANIIKRNKHFYEITVNITHVIFTKFVVDKTQKLKLVK